LFGRRGVTRGTKHRRWVSLAAFEAEDTRRVAGPDRSQADYGWWREAGESVGRLTYIFSTNEVIVTGGTTDDPVELLAVMPSEAAVDRLLDGWEYAASGEGDLRWARMRLAGWRVPLPANGQWWREVDARPPKPWPGPPIPSGSLPLDRLGYVLQPRIVYTFRDEVVARLDESFVLTYEEIDAWIDAHGAWFAENPRAVPLDPYAAGGAYG
jgi:hypothetical protein